MTKLWANRIQGRHIELQEVEVRMTDYCVVLVEYPDKAREWIPYTCVFDQRECLTNREVYRLRHGG